MSALGRAADYSPLLLLLRERFGPVPDPLAARIRSIADPAALDALLIRAIHLEHLDELFRA